MNSDPAINTNSAAWLCGLLQFGDTFYPTGSYAHSFGLEGLVAESVVHDHETLRQFLLISTLPALRQSELPLVVHVWRALDGSPKRYLLADAQSDGARASTRSAPRQEADNAEHVLNSEVWQKIGELCELSSALKTAREARFAAENIGRQRIELAAKMRAHPLAVEFLQRAETEGWPFSPAIAAALEARVLGAPLEAALASVYYTAIAGLLGAAMKLLRFGQNGCQTLLTEMMGMAPEIFAAAQNVPTDKIGWFNPWLDIAAARHETAAARLFIS